MRASDVRHRISPLAGGVLLCACCTSGSAAPSLGLDLALEARATDNVLREPGDGKSDVVYTPELRLSYLDERALFDLSLDYQLQRRVFRDGSFEDDTVVQGTASLTADVIPERLGWDLTHTRTQALVEPRGVDIPDNQQEFDTLGVGWQAALLPPTGRQRVDLSARVDRQQGNQPGSDSLRYSGGLQLSRQLSPRQTVGLAGDFLQVDYDFPGLPTFDRTSAALTAQRQGRRWTLDGRAGYNWIDRRGTDRNGGYTFDLGLEWALTPRQTLSLNAGQRITDQTADAQQGIPLFDLGGLATVEFGGQTFEDTTMRASYTYRAERFTASLDASRAQQDFEVLARDQVRTDYRARLSYALSRQLSLNTGYGLSSTEFEDEGREDERVDLSLDLAWTLGPSTRFTAGVRYERQDSDGSEVDFEETAFILSFRRTLIRPRS